MKGPSTSWDFETAGLHESVDGSVALKMKSKPATDIAPRGYGRLLGEIEQVVHTGRKGAVWAVNTIMSAVYWELGRRIVEFEQGGRPTAEYGERAIGLLARDLSCRFGRGFGKSNLYQFRAFYLAYPQIFQSPLGKSSTTRKKTKTSPATTPKAVPSAIFQAPLGKSLAERLAVLSAAFPLPWTHYFRLLSLKSDHARRFYEKEALRGGWSSRQLDRQIASQLYERTGLSRNKADMLRGAEKAQAADLTTPEEEIKSPYVLEFLGLKDEYSESDLEAALIEHLEQFLVELGSGFTFVARQRRLRIGGEWYRMDLLFFHRRLRCLVLIDLKVGKFTHADAGQMHLYCSYAREHWMEPGENPPVGLILCAEKDAAVAHYALEGLPSKIMATEYKLELPDEKLLEEELEQTRRLIETRRRT
jgi:predicted nuclease of restriction endonuclease-like (RecB) superfamily